MLGFQLIRNAQPRGRSAIRARTRGRGGACPAAAPAGVNVPGRAQEAASPLVRGGLVHRNLHPPGIPVTRPTKAIQTQTRRPAAATRDCFQAQKAGSELKSGCLGDSLINSHATRLRPHSNPVPEAARVQEHGRVSRCRAASAELALRTCTRVTSVRSQKTD